jgi:hypothetical protein
MLKKRISKRYPLDFCCLIHWYTLPIMITVGRKQTMVIITIFIYFHFTP